MNLQTEQFTNRTRGFLESAQGLAIRNGHQNFTPEHILKVLLDDAEGLAANLITTAGGRPTEALQQVEAALGALPKVEGPGAGQEGPPGKQNDGESLQGEGKKRRVGSRSQRGIVARPHEMAQR